MNGNWKKYWPLAALAALAAAAWWWQRSQSGDGTGAADGTGDASGGDASGAAPSDNAGSSQGLAGTLTGYAQSFGEALGIVQPKGIRNNNPGNLRYFASIPWKGQTGDDGTGYAVFDSPENGVRALGHQLRTYMARGLLTVTQIIATWAPPNENNTAAYIGDVSVRLGVDADTPLNVRYLPALAVAIVWHENGQNPYGDDTVQAWSVEP